jgi:hypothetical protein
MLSFDDGGKDEEDETISGSNKTIGSAAVSEMRKKRSAVQD